MSHDRGCFRCGEDRISYEDCTRPDCPKKGIERLVPRYSPEDRHPFVDAPCLSPGLVVRPTRDQLGLALAADWAKRGTCARRKVGCVLMDADGYQLSSGYNGPAAGEAHCTEHPCAGAKLPPGTGLDLCEAVHAEANALLRCPDPRLVRVAYVTASPCVHCVKLLMNTGCERIIFSERYAHDAPAEALWTRTPFLRIGRIGEPRVMTIIRTWEHTP